MSTALSLVLSGMVASYETVEPSAPVSKSPAKSKAVKSAPISATVKAANPSAHVVKPSDVKPASPKLGTISAEKFLDVVKNYNASWNWEENPATHTTPKLGTTRQDVENALSGYVGFDTARCLFDQVTMATRQAQLEVNPKLRPVTAKPTLTVVGLVAGMPDHRAKRYNSLVAREKWTVEAIVAFDKVSNVEQFRKACQDHFDSAALALILPVIDRLPLSDAQKQADDYRIELAKIRKDLAAEFG